MANEYKDTLLIGQTNFDMRAGLKEKEPNFQSFWKLNDIYNQKLKLNENKTHFVLHDGPPYANGDLHIGHALNKILKDMIVRWKNSNGFYAPFILGWDTHGLPIETAVTKTGVDRKAIDPVEFRNLCRKFALEQIEKQASQFNRLGIFTDYDVKYVTLNHNYEISELKLFAKMYKKGLIYKALKPIYWSPSSESALAESEIEYQDIKSPSVFVACEITKGNNEVKTGTNLIIWTTTPWTLPSNQLIAVGANIGYVLVKPENDNREFIVAKSLVEELSSKLEWVNCSILKTLTASDLVDLEYSHPLYEEKISKVVLGHHVTDESGTGLVHIAGGFGEDDYQIVKQNNLEPFAPIDNQGKFTNEISILDKELVGKFYEDTNKEIGQRLQEKNKLLKLNFVKHSYPHDWRTKKPVIYRCTLQWFVNLEIVKDDILANVETVETNPTWAKKRLYQVLNDRNDWTISRQRLWGVPIIGFYNQDNELVLTNEILAYAIEKINELGTNAWFSNPADDFLPDEYKNKGYTKEKDILDVWFDSGVSAIALNERFKHLELPYDIYLEGNDQYRGWFNSSMITSTVYSGKSPYKKLVSHGMTTDEKGNKMSKSLGNGIDPIQISNDLGADILRLWVSSTDYTDDQKVGPEILKQISESYRKIRNTMRFILANLSDFDSNLNYQSTLNEVDEFALHNLSISKIKIIEAYENLQFNQVYNLVINYVTKDLSSFYLDFIKDILYIEKSNSQRRRQVQTVLYEQLWFLIDVLRPILVHTIEEVYQELNENNKEKSVHLLDVRKQEFTKDELFINKWKEIMRLRDDVNKALEESREEKLISKGFEAILSIQIDKDEFNIAAINDLAQIFIVNEIKFINNISNAKQYEIAKINIVKNEGLKCQRCWMIVDNLINDSICERCSKVLAN